MLVLVEGESDAGAVRALASLVGVDLAAAAIEVRPASGVTNFARELEKFVTSNPGESFCGMYDAADERHVRRALRKAGVPIGAEEWPAAYNFFPCNSDLEDELIRALGASVVENVLASEGELASLRRFQAMPEHRGSQVSAQLHRFLGTRATRKIRAGRLLTERLDPAGLPQPLQLLAGKLREAAARAVCAGDA
jgi:hypothetical protein